MKGLWSQDPQFGLQMRCALCRCQQKSSKSFCKTRDICLSCHMRGNNPRWLNIENHAVARWREEVTMTEFAKACGVSQPRMHVIERTRYVTSQVARKLATGLVVIASNGAQLRAAVQEWPLFPLLADQSLLTWNTPDPDEKESSTLGVEE
jgi:hypothetical protein